MTQEEAEVLINALKSLERQLITIPNPSRKEEYLAYEVENKNSQFRIIIRRMKMNPEKCTFQAMTKDTNKVLLRLDIVPDDQPHKNPDGEMIYGTHLHVFKEGFDVGYAFKFDINDPDLTKTCVEFLHKFNVITNGVKVIESTTLFN